MKFVQALSSSSINSTLITIFSASTFSIFAFLLIFYAIFMSSQNFFNWLRLKLVEKTLRVPGHEPPRMMCKFSSDDVVISDPNRVTFISFKKKKAIT